MKSYLELIEQQLAQLLKETTRATQEAIESRQADTHAQQLETLERLSQKEGKQP